MTNSHSTFQELKKAEKEARKQMILHTTLKLFGQKQISEVSMRDIAKEAGISPALIYRHFNDRDELFVEAFVLKSQEMIDFFHSKASHKEDFTIKEIGQEFIYYLMNNPLFFKMMSYFMLDYTLMAEHLERFNDTIRDLLTIFDQGFIQNGLNKDIRLYSHAFFSALNGIMITFHHYPGRSPEEIDKHIEKLTSIISELFKEGTEKK